MRAISVAELERLVDASEDSMNDTCDIHVPTIVMTALGTQEKVFTSISNVACGFNILGEAIATKTYRGEVTTEDVEALLRLPFEQEYQSNYEVTVRGQRYKTESIRIGKTSKLIGLKRVSANG